MDEKMRKLVGKPLKKAQSFISKARKNNERLAKEDEKVRDPMIERYKKMKKKKC